MITDSHEIIAKYNDASRAGERKDIKDIKTMGTSARKISKIAVSRDTLSLDK